MKQVILEGFLGEKYGRNWEIRASSYQDIFSCIDANYPEFRLDLMELHDRGGDISILSGGELMENVEDLLYPIDVDTIVITPLPTGSKSGGAKLIIGALLIASLFIPGVGGALLASSLALTGGTFAATVVALTVASIGINLAIAGIQQLLAPDPSVDEKDQDYLFNGPAQVTASGNPVPLLVGEMIVGGIVMSSAIIPGLSTGGGDGHIVGTSIVTGPGVINLPGAGGATTPGGTPFRVGGVTIYPVSPLPVSPVDIIRSDNVITAPFSSKPFTQGVTYIVPVVGHEVPSDLYEEHKVAVSKQYYQEDIDWTTFVETPVGTLPNTASLFKILDGIGISAEATTSSLSVTASLAVTLDTVTLSAEADAAYVASTDYTLDSISIASEAVYTGAAELTASLAATLEAITATITANADFIATLSSVLDDTGITSTAVSDYIANSDITLDGITFTSAATYTAGSSYETEADALFARMATDPGSTRKGHVNTLIATLKSDGIWSKLDCLFVFAAHERATALLDWKQTRTAADVGTGPNFTTDSYISNVASATSNYLNTTVDASTAGRTSASHFGIVTQSSGAYRRIIEENTGYLGSYIQTPDPTNTRARMKFADIVELGGSTSSARTHLVAVDNGTNLLGYRDASNTHTGARVSYNYHGVWRMLADDDTANNMKVFVFHFGDSLSSTEVTNLEAALDTYLTALGV